MKTKAILTVAVPLCVILSVAEADGTGDWERYAEDTKEEAKHGEKLDEITRESVAKDKMNDAQTEIEPEKPETKVKPEDKRSASTLEEPEEPEPTAEEEPEPKPEKEPEHKAEKEPEPKPEKEPEPKPEKEPETKPEKEPETTPEKEREGSGKCRDIKDAVECTVSLRNVGDRLTTDQEEMTSVIAKNSFNDQFAELDGRYQIPECCVHRSGFREIMDDTGLDSKEATLDLKCKVTNAGMRIKDGTGRRHLRGDVDGPWERTAKITLANLREKTKDPAFEHVDKVEFHCKGRGTYVAEAP